LLSLCARGFKFNYLVGYLLSPNSVAFHSHVCADEWEISVAWNSRRHILIVIGFVIFKICRTDGNRYVRMYRCRTHAYLVNAHTFWDCNSLHWSPRVGVSGDVSLLTTNRTIVQRVWLTLQAFAQCRNDCFSLHCCEMKDRFL
jgi:hypothetical protein